MANPEIPSSLAQLLAVLKSQAGGVIENDRPLPPVERWNPSRCGDIGLEILRDGAWRHQGAPIAREALVRLFSTILRKDADGQTYLVTPGEKVRVRVEDAPFTAIRVDRHGTGETQTLAFTTNVGDVVTAGSEHPIRVAGDRAEPRPHVLVRGRLEARILRAPIYELAEWAEPRDGKLGVWSGGVWFEIGDAA